MSKRLKAFISASNVPDAVRREIVASLYPRSFRIGTSILTSIVNGAVLAVVTRSWMPLAWMAVALVICGVRTLDWWQYQHTPEAHSTEQWASRFTIGFLPFGLWWGTTALLLFMTNDPLAMAIAVLSTDAQGAGAVCSYPAHPPAALVFVIPAMVAFAIAGAIHGGAIGYSITFVEIVLIVNYAVIIREFYRSTIRGMILRDEKLELAENLLEAHAALKREGIAKSEFLAHMSHELRTPLNAIIGFAEVMTTGLFGPIGHPKYEEYLKDIRSSASHLLNIINEVLDVARIEAGELTLHIGDVDATYIVKFAERLIEQRAQEKNLTIEIELDPQLLQITFRTDEVRLKQVIINLLSNAIKFTGQNGNIRLEAGIRDTDVFFEIADNGVGMSAEDLKRSLLPFMQVGNTKLTQEGTGLGLPLSRQLIERLGGKFHIVSELGAGTTVTITLPINP
jgi:signal transduction histidine kinase